MSRYSDLKRQIRLVEAQATRSCSPSETRQLNEQADELSRQVNAAVRAEQVERGRS